MLLGLLGDVHGDFDAVERAMSSEPRAAAWLSVGDIASESGAYPAPSRPFFFIKGNNEDFDVVARLQAGEDVVAGLRLIPNGHAILVEGVHVAGLGGTFAPKWYDTRPEELPAAHRRAGLSAPARAKLTELRRTHHSLGDGGQTRRAGGPSGPPRDDKRRHFVRAEVDACLGLRGIDLFLTHEAPRPYWVGAGPRRNDAGKTVINEILAAMRPRLHVFGHHHKHSERVVEGVPSVGLPLAHDGYLLLDSDAWNWSFKSGN